MSTPTAMDPRMMTLPIKADQSSDGHPDALLEWVTDGHTTPRTWYHLAAYTAKGHLMMILRERIHGEDARKGKEGVDRTTLVNRGIYWHVVKEFVEEVARQLREGERQAFAWSTGNNRFVGYPVGYTVVSYCHDDEAGTWEHGEPVHAPEKKPSPEPAEPF